MSFGKLSRRNGARADHPTHHMPEAQLAPVVLAAVARLDGADLRLYLLMLIERDPITHEFCQTQAAIAARLGSISLKTVSRAVHALKGPPSNPIGAGLITPIRETPRATVYRVHNLPEVISDLCPPATAADAPSTYKTERPIMEVTSKLTDQTLPPDQTRGGEPDRSEPAPATVQTRHADPSKLTDQATTAHRTAPDTSILTDRSLPRSPSGIQIKTTAADDPALNGGGGQTASSGGAEPLTPLAREIVAQMRSPRKRAQISAACTSEEIQAAYIIAGEIRGTRDRAGMTMALLLDPASLETVRARAAKIEQDFKSAAAKRDRGAQEQRERLAQASAAQAEAARIEAERRAELDTIAGATVRELYVAIQEAALHVPNERMRRTIITNGQNHGNDRERLADIAARPSVRAHVVRIIGQIRSGEPRTIPEPAAEAMSSHA